MDTDTQFSLQSAFSDGSCRSSFRSALDIVVQELKSRIHTVEETTEDPKVNQNEIIRSLEFTQSDMKDLIKEVKVLQNSESENRAIINILYNPEEKMERKCEMWEETAVTMNKIT